MPPQHHHHTVVTAAADTATTATATAVTTTIASATFAALPTRQATADVFDANGSLFEQMPKLFLSDHTHGN
jgi:hypothetical protein